MFLPTVRHDLLPWDDVHILQALSLVGDQASSDFSTLLTPRVLGHWIPLTWASYAVDRWLWSGNPAGYHLTNVLLHGLNAALVSLAGRRLLSRAAPRLSAGAIEAGAVAAGLAFALHPLRVESVAWVTERRDVLAGALFLVTVLAYLRAVERPGRTVPGWTGLALVTYAGSLLAKPITMTLPVVLLLLDVYPLRRFAGWPTLREKAPFAALAVAGAALAAAGQAADIGFTGLDALSPAARVALLAHSLVFYPVQTLVPLGVSPLHELPARVDPLAPRFLVPAATAAAVTTAAVLVRRAAPWLLAAWSYAAITILPVSGLAHVATILAADRYSYLSGMGWALVLGGGAAALLGSAARRWLVVAGLAGLASLLGAWGALTWRYVGVWGDPERLWRFAVAAEPDCAQCRGHLAVALLQANRLDEAADEATLAVLLRPDRADHHAFLASVLERQGRLDQAAGSWASAARLHPHYRAEAHRALGVALARRQRYEEALSHLRDARALDPGPRATLELVRTLNELASARVRAGRWDEAERALVDALALWPESHELQANLAALRATRTR
jgi:hypothetical protein